MHKVIALIRASWLEAASYRMRTVLTFVALIAGAVPFYYVARGLQSVVGQSIQHEGGDYFGFLVVGMMAFAFMRTAVGALPDEITGAISSGTLEALLGTPTRLATLLTGMVGYSFTWSAVRCFVFLVFARFMGAHLLWRRAPLALAILLVIILAHLAFGLFSAALILAFRTSGPLPSGVIWLSTILGGVYYPTQVVPWWLERVSTFVPLAYGLRPLRRTLLEPAITVSALAADLIPLCVMTAVLLGSSLWAFSRALRYARGAGTLAQY
jgi:ABC-2 type transport system permease protein